MNGIDSMKNSESLIEEFLFIKPSLKFLIKKNIIEFNLLIEDFLRKAEDVYDDKELVNLSVIIGKCDIDDKIKIKLLVEINKIMYNLHHNEVLKAELKEISDALNGVL